MPAIFFDLETSDSNCIGEIVNYSFIAVDDALRPVDELSGTVRLSRLELPSPEALLVNRVRILDHQAQSKDDEGQAARKIASFIADACNRCSERVPLVGFNSNRFDIPFIRTVLIRNGINPYFGGRILYRDLLLCARKLSVTHKKFPRVASATGEHDRLSLRLETVARALKLFSGAQAHESREDVLLTIDVARCFREEFGLDVLGYEPYEVAPEKTRALLSQVVFAAYPEYDLNAADHRQLRPMALLDASHRYALWADLQEYAEGQGRKSIRWFNVSTHAFFTDGVAVKDTELMNLAAKACTEFKGLTVSNFFEKSTCDIEQDIYRLDFDGIDALGEAIARGDDSRIRALRGREGKILYLRWQLKNYCWGSTDDDRIRRMLAEYARHRYGGTLQISKTSQEEATEFHETAAARKARILEKRGQLSGADDREILDQLLEYYEKSDIAQVAPELFG